LARDRPSRAAGERDEIWATGLEIFPGLAQEQAWAGERHIAAFILERG
jgi:hypothetical protein